MAGPTLANGLVTVQGDKIVAVESRGARTADEDLGNVALIPGLVNAHTHLDLSGARGVIPPTDPDHFTDWLRGVIAYRRTRTDLQVKADIRHGLAECLRSGTTLLGDITADGASWEPLAASLARAVVFRELIGGTKQRFGEASTAASNARLTHPSTPTCIWGKSPHAPYSVHKSGYWLTVQVPGVFAVHLAESPDEVGLIERRAGSFVTFLEDLGVWNPEGLATSLLDFVTAPAVDARVLFVHANYIDPTSPFRASQSIVYCPRTHAAFGHPPHPFREFLARGVRVCLGTDSLASNPDLDILAEARFVHDKHPDFPGDALLRMVTLAGAEALGWADECGSLEAGKSADVVAVPLPDRDAPDPHELLFSNHPGDRHTMFRGAWRG